MLYTYSFNKPVFNNFDTQCSMVLQKFVKFLEEKILLSHCGMKFKC